MVSQRAKHKIKKKNEKLRKTLWKDVDDDQLWDKSVKGFVTLPSSMSIILQMMDLMCVGVPVSTTYLSLWCNTWDSPMVEIKSEQLIAFESGFTGQRAVTTWRQRMKRLIELGFIKVSPGAYGDYSYVLILNPHLVIQSLLDSGTLEAKAHYAALLEKAVTRGFSSEFDDKDDE